MTPDHVIIGSGITGATIARQLTDAGLRVLVIDRREQVGGNVHDSTHSSGVRIHTFGPHYFRTNSERIWGFVNRFSSFYPYRARVQSWVNGRHETWPVTESYLRRNVGPCWEPARTEPALNFEEACLRMMPGIVYENFVRGYTEKQWGVPACTLNKDLAGRFDVRRDDEQDFSRHKYQGIPSSGYAAFTKSLLKGIPQILGCDYLKCRDSIKPRQMLIFTGPIDEFFGFELGRLRYRAQSRVHEFHPDRTFIQPVGQVNNPESIRGSFIRTLEWKHMMRADEALAAKGTVLTREYPFTPDNPDSYEYPFPDESNSRLYKSYRERANALRGTIICGRLGEYRYYDMDQAIARAMTLSERIVHVAKLPTSLRFKQGFEDL